MRLQMLNAWVVRCGHQAPHIHSFALRNKRPSSQFPTKKTAIEQVMLGRKRWACSQNISLAFVAKSRPKKRRVATCVRLRAQVQQ